MAATATHDSHEVKLPDATVDVAPIRKVALGAAVIGLGAWLIMGFINMGVDYAHGTREFFISYLCGFIFWTSLPFGGLALMMLGLLTQATWAVIFRRIFSAAIRTLPVLALLGVPVIVSLYIQEGKQSPYWWAEQSLDKPVDEVAKDLKIRPEAAEEMQHKIHDYLNPSFFIGRYVVYFLILGTIAFFMLKWLRPYEDDNNLAMKHNLYGLSGPGVLVWALVMAFFSTDWVMSVEPTWASSMFPIVFGMNQFLTAITFSTLVFYTLTQGKSDLTAIIKDKFRIDIGTLTLAFCMIWAYASFCQFMLIWAGNLPEELTYYLKRGAGEERNDWLYLSYFLILCHWFIPFIVLLFRDIKLNPKSMRILAVGLLTVCAADIVFWIVPSMPHEKSMLHVPMAFAAILGVGGVWGLAFVRELAKRPILANNNEVKFMATWGYH